MFIHLLELNKKNTISEDFEEKSLFNFSYLLSNIKDSQLVNVIFLSKEFNQVLDFDFDFENYFVVSRYVGLLKSISLKFKDFPFQMFYNQVIMFNCIRKLFIFQFFFI